MDTEVKGHSVEAVGGSEEGRQAGVTMATGENAY